jgi:hypothetical protein
MRTSPTFPSRDRRARRAFWMLVAGAVLAAGSLTGALAAAAAPVTGLWTAASGTVLVVSLSLAVRILNFLDRARRAQSQPPESSSAAADGRAPAGSGNGVGRGSHEGLSAGDVQDNR